MGSRKFEVGVRVRVTYQKAPKKFKGRVGTINDYRTYEGYGIEFDDKPGSIECLSSSWLEVLALDRTNPSALGSNQHDLKRRRAARYEADCSVAIRVSRSPRYRQMC